MATQAVAGRIGFMAISATSTGTAAEIAEIRGWNLQVTRADIDATSNDSSGWHEGVAGIAGWTATFNAVYARTDNEQVLLRESLSSAATRFYTLQPTTAQSAKWTGTGRLTQYDVGGTHDGIALFNCSVVGTGALTYTT